ncbi:hypothetical protein E5F05_14925 [Deinococcus metallilatus]|uniref:ABC-2 type transport system permease protein n=1 Tax=Deinococcus metallilatus TaxID=1211322 RepID=A0AAJ5JX72_9DEIO|nr:ABC transporter permease subunit [Deinococcus metallilatus]MBB5294367.1 ABC-2 type transport system permease protein [Deinococcus metallilatus]QBY09133.1 hypothetical protein E5F05_14925 [Deinococcus metallilatus]RXJ10277.1 hypothetical protein ERJ73_13755 [Deinococcus metallilatus]TLK22569.1 hypothetical protein FCS05_17630 [Deinococcus metallilatus]GMA16296.1 hypothetical protein GCM10025871_26270 [Deinococcus metallilatus]
MWPEILRESLRDARRGWLWWAIGLLLYVLLILAFYPSIKSDPSVNEIMHKLPASLRVLFGEDLTTPAGYVGGRLFSLMPILLSVFAGLTGAALIAGEEARGHLEFPLAQPVSRRALLVGRTLTLLLLLLGLGLVLFLGTWAPGQVFQAPLPAARVLETAALHTLGAWVFGALALAVGAATGRAGVAAAVGAGLGTLLVVLHTLSGQVAALRDLAWLNPWKEALGGSPLLHPVSVTPLLVCLLVGAAFALIAAPFFQNRDVGR